MANNSDDYLWTLGEVRKLDSTLNELREEIKLLRVEMKQKPLVVDNRNKPDWKALAIIIGATVATAIVTAQQVIGQ